MQSRIPPLSFSKNRTFTGKKFLFLLKEQHEQGSAVLHSWLSCKEEDDSLERKWIIAARVSSGLNGR